MKLSLVRKMKQKELGKIDSFSKRKIKRKPIPNLFIIKYVKHQTAGLRVTHSLKLFPHL